MVWTRIVHCVLVGKQQGKDHADRLNVDGTILLKYIWIIYSQDSVESDCNVEGKGASVEQNSYLEGLHAPHNNIEALTQNDTMNNSKKA